MDNWFLFSSFLLICRDRVNGILSDVECLKFFLVLFCKFFGGILLLFRSSFGRYWLGFLGRLIGWKEIDVSRICIGREGWVRGLFFY